MGNFFDINSYLSKAEKEYLLEGKQEYTFPIRLTDQIRANARRFEAEISRVAGIEITGYANRRIEGVRLGIPSELRFRADLLFKYRPELQKINALFAAARNAARYLNLELFLKSNLTEAKKKHLDLESAVRAVEFILEHKPDLIGLYPRQVPHGQSTKLLMEDTLARRLLAFHYGRPRLSVEDIRNIFSLRKKPSYFHFYVDQIRYDGVELVDHHGVITESNLNRFDFSDVKKVLIVENAEIFHAAQGKTGGMIILGNGDKAASIAFLEPVLRNLQVFYWGDIDKDGYEAFETVRHGLKHLKPLAMDMGTIESYFYLNQKRESQAPLNREFLLKDEYRRVCSEGIRIEQEQMPLSEILALTELLP